MYDLVIIGAGWAGFNAALKAKNLGLKVCLIDKSQIGGTCLNRGCIPTKALIQSAKIFSLSKKSKVFGIENSATSVNYPEILKRKYNIIQQLQKGMQSLLKDITYLNEEAKLVSAQTIKAGNQEIETKAILIATGSKPTELSKFKFDGKKIISSDDILNLDKIPESLLIIGGGVIGCEFASLFSCLGAKVTIAEKMPQLLPLEDKEVALKLAASFKKRQVKIFLGADAAALDLNEYSLVMVCVGRTPVTEGLNLKESGVNLDGQKIVVDDFLKTNVPNIYAAGDCTAKTMLAHFAAYQGKIAAKNIANPGSPEKADNNVIPNCIFTDPEISSIGLREEEAKGEGLTVNINRFDLMGNAMARILDATDGFVKIVSDAETGKVLGASIIGERATELISVFSVAITCGLKVSDIRNTVLAHPTLSEVIKEALD